MQELERRLRIAEISANVQGVNADNFIKFCNTLEGWVATVGEDDPLRLDMPGPAPQHLLDEMKRIKGLDWNRPQLVKSIAIDGIVVETTGYHEESVHGTKIFYGYEFEVGKGRIAPCCHWYCDHFVYYGEIEEPKNPGKKEINWGRRQILASSTGVLVEVSSDGDEAGRFNGYRLDEEFKRVSPVCNWHKSHFAYHGEIPQEQPTQPRTSGLNFLEAIELLTDGVVMRRASWGEDIGYMYSDGSHLRDEKDDPCYCNSIDNFLATDWQIIEP